MPRDAHGVHEYHPEEYGIDLNAVRERFRFYTDRFGISTSDAPDKERVA